MLICGAVPKLFGIKYGLTDSTDGQRAAIAKPSS